MKLGLLGVKRYKAMLGKRRAVLFAYNLQDAIKRATIHFGQKPDNVYKLNSLVGADNA